MWQNFGRIVFSGVQSGPLNFQLSPSCTTQFCRASHKTFGTKGHTNLQRRDEFAGGYGGCWTVTILGKRWREILQPFGGILRNPTTVRTPTQTPCLVGIPSFVFLMGGRNKPISRLIFFCGEKNWCFKRCCRLCDLYRFFFHAYPIQYHELLVHLRFAKNPPQHWWSPGHRFGEKNKTSNDPNILDISSLILGSWISTCTVHSGNQKNVPWKREQKIERTKIIFLNHPCSVGKIVSS